MDYKTLEPSNLSSLGVPAPSFNGAPTSFLATSTFLYTLFFIAIVGAAFYRYALAGILRMEASEAGIRKSNEVFKRVTLGLLGVFSLFLILFTVNKGLVTGDVGFGELQIRTGKGGSGSVGVGVVPAPGQGGSGGSSRSCEATSVVITKLTSSGGICGGTACTILSGCNYQQYLSLINKETGGDGELQKMIIVTMCKESGARKESQHKNENGTFDCGLMQINQPGVCDATILNPENNIKMGVTKMREKIAASSRVYQNIPARAGVFASYNCCANGTVPNAPSADCTQASGFPYTIPKWACPINPGESAFNMCSVKSYACELSACLLQL